MLTKVNNEKKYNPQLGFTLIELIVVIAIMGILVLVTVPVYTNYIEDARLAYDNVSVKTLNDATYLYALDTEKSTKEIFAGVASDVNKIGSLLSRGYISAIPVPKHKDSAFLFSQETGLWSLTSTSFSSDFTSLLNTKTLNGEWGIKDGKITATKTADNDLLLLNTDGTDYSIKVDATYLSGGACRSGYGIYYRATDSPTISGYCFQFDPGAQNSFLVNKFTDRNESPAFQKVSMVKVMADGFNIKALHSVEIDVVGTRHVIKVDGITVFDFTDDSFTTGSVGLRTWNDTAAQFSKATVTKS